MHARWVRIVIAVIAWSSVWSGGVTAEDGATPFRRACDLLTAEAVSAVLGEAVTPAAAMPDAWCSYLHDERPVVEIGLDPTLPLVFARPLRATEVTVGGLPALSGSSGHSSVVMVGLPDGGILWVDVGWESGFDSPLALARSLAEAILATGPVTAHASSSIVEPVGFAGSPCELVTLEELERLTGQRFTRTRLDVNRVSCRYRTADRKEELSVSLGPGHFGVQRSGDTVDLTVRDRPAIFVPATRILAVDLGAGQVLGVRAEAVGGVAVEDLPALRVAIAETAIGRMTPGGPTCSLIATDALLRETGLDVQPIAGAGPDACWFVTPDEQGGLFLRMVTGSRRDIAYARQRVRARFPFADRTTPADFQVSSHPAFGATGPTGSILRVDLDSSGRDRKAFFASLDGTHSSVTDPLAVLASIAANVIDRR